MKKSFILIIVALLTLFTSVITCTASDNDATLKAEYSYDGNGKTITVDARFVDIKAKEGIITIEYHIEYDKNALELISYETVFPEDWKPLLENQMVEDFSEKKEEGRINWTFVVIAVGKGAKEDNELGIKLSFKPLNNSKTDIKFNCKDIGTEVLENGKTVSLEHISGNSLNIAVDLSEPEKSEISEIDPNAPAGNNSQSANASTGNNAESINDNSEDSNVDNEQSDNSLVLWIVIGIGVLGVAAVIVLVSKTKKG